jgi:hypothetical protein
MHWLLEGSQEPQVPRAFINKLIMINYPVQSFNFKNQVFNVRNKNPFQVQQHSTNIINFSTYTVF